MPGLVGEAGYSYVSTPVGPSASASARDLRAGVRGASASAMKEVLDDALAVEVVEHFGSELVDELVDTVGEVFAALLDLDQFGAGERIHHFPQGTKGFENVHGNFAESQGCISYSRVDDGLDDDEVTFSDSCR